VDNVFTNCVHFFHASFEEVIQGVFFKFRIIRIYILSSPFNLRHFAGSIYRDIIVMPVNKSIIISQLHIIIIIIIIN
jgi:hypothetical protein